MEHLHPVPKHSGPDATDKVVVRKAVSALPPRQKSALLLRYFADLRVAQIAVIMECPEGTVKSLINRAMKALGQQLDNQETEAAVHGT